MEHWLAGRSNNLHKPESADRSHHFDSQSGRDLPFHTIIPPSTACSIVLKIQPRTYFKKYMKKSTYRYVRYYLEIPKRIAETRPRPARLRLI